MNIATLKAASARIGNSAERKLILLKDIGAKWGKFSEKELSALKSKDDRVAQVATSHRRKLMSMP
jgi:hypothetical protein